MINSYLDYIGKVRRYSQRTQAIYAGVLEDFVRYSLGLENVHEAAEKDIVDIMNPRSIRNYEVYLIDTKGLNARTVNLHLSVLSGFAKFLMKLKKLPTNPVRQVSRPKMEKRLPAFYRKESMNEYFSRTASWTLNENLELLQGKDATSKELYGKRLNRLVISLLYNTGMRRSELLSLRRSSFDESRGIIRVVGKGDKMREIPIVYSLSNEILLYLQARELVGLGVDSASSPLLVSATGAELYPMMVDRIVKEELGEIDSITGRKSPHVLRHTIATELLDEGTDLNSIKELLGHSSLSATQVYTHNSIEKLRTVYNNAHPRAKNGGKNGD